MSSRLVFYNFFTNLMLKNLLFKKVYVSLNVLFRKSFGKTMTWNNGKLDFVFYLNFWTEINDKTKIFPKLWKFEKRKKSTNFGINTTIKEEKLS